MSATETPRERSRRLRDLAREAGFDAVGIARVQGLRGTEDGARLARWLEAGEHATMVWMERTRDRRLDPDAVLLGAQAVVSLALDYGDPGPDVPGSGTGRIARYARGRDYHKVFGRKLRALEARLLDAFPAARTRRYVDTGPVLEKLWAERAGLGWRGKHTNLVSRERGSWFLLGEILTDLDLEPDGAETDHCGTCVRCLDACPTRALVAPYRLDARLCISYLTIEHRGAIPRALRPLIGDRVFGCDACLEVCPWNRFAQAAREADFRPRPEAVAPLLAELVALDAKGFLDRFAGTAVMRAKREGLARNACVALGNVGGPGAVDALAEALGDGSPLVRGHAAWALSRLGGEAAREHLRHGLARETDAEARAEFEAALAEVTEGPNRAEAVHSPQT